MQIKAKKATLKCDICRESVEGYDIFMWHRVQKHPYIEKRVHIKPYIGYRPGTFIEVLGCISCGSIGDNYSMHRAIPCIVCGGNVKSIGAGKWNSIKQPWYLFLKEKGYWEIKHWEYKNANN